jgi:hypothetical protein
MNEAASLGIEGMSVFIGSDGQIITDGTSKGKAFLLKNEDVIADVHQFVRGKITMHFKTNYLNCSFERVT